MLVTAAVVREEEEDSLSSGMNSLVSGRSSPIRSRNTENDNNTVIPIVTFSPESGGKQKTSNVRADMVTHGNTTL